jgi:predicted kinase
MDLEFQGADSFSNVFLNHYLENNGDYAMLALLNFYKVYRALVRAKIALFTAGSMDAGSDAFNAQWDNYHQYILLALSYTQTKNKQCFITFGVSGSGKSYVSEQMIQHTPLIRIRSDIERKRYFANADKNTLYSEETTLKTYQLLIKISQMILTSGISVIVDATFIKQTQRQLFNDLCHKMNTPLTILAIETTKDVLEKRLTARATDNTNVSDADIKIMQQQLATLEPLNDNEVHLCKQILNNNDANQLKSQLYTLFN